VNREISQQAVDTVWIKDTVETSSLFNRTTRLPTTWDHATVTQETSADSPASWPQPGWQSDLTEAAGAFVPHRVHDVDQLKLWLVEAWEHFQQAFIDEAVRQWRPRLRACIPAHGEHFEDRL